MKKRKDKKHIPVIVEITKDRYLINRYNDTLESRIEKPVNFNYGCKHKCDLATISECDNDRYKIESIFGYGNRIEAYYYYNNKLKGKLVITSYNNIRMETNECMNKFVEPGNVQYIICRGKDQNNYVFRVTDYKIDIMQENDAKLIIKQFNEQHLTAMDIILERNDNMYFDITTLKYF